MSLQHWINQLQHRISRHRAVDRRQVYTDLDSGHDAGREEDQLQAYEDRFGRDDRLPWD